MDCRELRWAPEGYLIPPVGAARTLDKVDLPVDANWSDLHLTIMKEVSPTWPRTTESGAPHPNLEFGALLRGLTGQGGQLYTYKA